MSVKHILVMVEKIYITDFFFFWTKLIVKPLIVISHLVIYSGELTFSHIENINRQGIK